MSETKLTAAQRALLLEAMRRYKQFHPGEELAEAWTGLGYYTDYEPVLSAGLMSWVVPGHGRKYMGWLQLTEAGAAIVQAWLDEEARPTIIDDILERRDSLQHLAQPPSTIALKAVTESLQALGYVVITHSLYKELSGRPVRT